MRFLGKCTAVVLFFALCHSLVAALIPGSLRCEYRIDPLGVDDPNPRLSWELESAERGQSQIAYRVLAASSRARLAAREGDLWDSGKVASNRSLQVLYQGKPLRSNQEVFWTVQVWDQAGSASSWSETARWTAGIMRQSDWKGQWIGYRKDQSADDPLPIFRREFKLEKTLRRAIVQISGLGQYELRLNGKTAGDRLIDPGWTNYRKTVLYSSYDVTSLLRRGENAIAVMLGNGMYNVQGGRYVKFTGSFGAPKLIFQLHLEFVDGSVTEIVSDGNWKASAGPIVFSCVFGGEDYDASREQEGWDRPGYDDSGWRKAILADDPGGTLKAQSAPPIRVLQTYKPVSVTEPAPGVYVYDLGQNFSGIPVLRVRGDPGAEVKLLPAELLDSQGLVDQLSSLGSKTHQGTMYFKYTLRGGDVETWSPRFTYFGFRYVQVEGATTDPSASGQPLILGLEGEFISSSSRTVGSFSCSKPLFNRIHALVDAAIRSNLQSIVTDCPHREKLGWLEVPYLMGPSIMYNFDAAALYSKIADDAGEAQHTDGFVADIAPEYVSLKGGFLDSPEWGSSYVVIPWLLYRTYGDVQVLKRHYEGMKRYVDYLGSRSENHIVSYGLGDWYDIGPKRPGPSQLTPLGLTATATYFEDVNIVARAARLLGMESDASKYGKLAGEVREAFNERFLDAGKGSYATGSQTANAMPLALGLAPRELRGRLVDNIVADVRRRGNHPSSGDVGHVYLIRALAEAGRSDVVFEMTAQTEAPSYGAQLKAGATALTEAWDAGSASSQNHCMLGHIQEWFHAHLAGIRQASDSVAFEKIVIDPQLAGDLTWVEAHYDSIRGRIASEWRRDGDHFALSIRIPPNTRATVHIPAKSEDGVTESGKLPSESEGVRFIRYERGKAIYEVGSGEYDFSTDFHGEDPETQRSDRGLR